MVKIDPKKVTWFDGLQSLADTVPNILDLKNIFREREENKKTSNLCQKVSERWKYEKILKLTLKWIRKCKIKSEISFKRHMKTIPAEIH